ncbi:MULTISPECIES: DUF6037 family protein [unclassified Leucobacter]
MEQSSTHRALFEHNHGRAVFRVVLLCDRPRKKLLFGLKGGQFAFSLELRWDGRRGCYWIADKLDAGTYRGLCEALQLTYDPSRPFKPAAFFAEFDTSVPRTLAGIRLPEPHEYPRVPEHEGLEQADRRYFKRWLPHDGVRSKPRPENLEKTREFFGDEFYRDCRDHLISSCWTDNPRQRRPVGAPLEELRSSPAATSQ